mmetsp:Transcript_75738/g.245437  ORF Transcript_75738/g.245437 Transcript_75738/m.245437 type:complete len:203 (-) Transcript_75738:171-779(-)
MCRASLSAVVASQNETKGLLVAREHVVEVALGDVQCLSRTDIHLAAAEAAKWGLLRPIRFVRHTVVEPGAAADGRGGIAPAAAAQRLGRETPAEEHHPLVAIELDEETAVLIDVQVGLQALMAGVHRHGERPRTEESCLEQLLKDGPIKERRGAGRRQQAAQVHVLLQKGVLNPSACGKVAEPDLHGFAQAHVRSGDMPRGS